MVSAFLNTVKIPELRRRILFTLAVIVIVRLGAAITTPGVNQAVIQEWFRTSLTENQGGNVAALFNLFSGGALENCAIFSLGIMPYISASIMMQLLTAVIPKLGRLAKEDGGRQKIMQFTRYATVGFALFRPTCSQFRFSIRNRTTRCLPGITETISKLGIPLVEDLGMTFRIVTVLSLTTGTLFLMWLGDQITGARDREWYLAYYHDRHCGAPARGAGAGVEDIRAIGGDRHEPGQSRDSRL